MEGWSEGCLSLALSEVLRCPLYGRYRGKSGSDPDIVKLLRMTLTDLIPRAQLTEENMRTLSMAFVGGFAAASMAGNVGTLHAAPLWQA